MAGDAEWVQDVRRWYFSGSQTPVSERGDSAAPGSDPGEEPIGYEAADPMLQAPHWPDLPVQDPAL